MIRFNCDYLEGAHPAIMEKLMETNFEQTPGYGEDIYCQQARELICEKCGVKDAYVQFLVGGTQTNLTVIASILSRIRECFLPIPDISMCMKRELLKLPDIRCWH